MCVHPGAVVVLPILPDGKVLLIKNYRYAVGETLLELPAGTLERGEEPINCAGRELIEETGYTAGRLKSMGSFFSSPGILSERMYAFAAYDLRPGEQQLEDGEQIESAPTDWDDVIDRIRSGDDPRRQDDRRRADVRPVLPREVIRGRDGRGRTDRITRRTAPAGSRRSCSRSRS